MNLKNLFNHKVHKGKSQRDTKGKFNLYFNLVLFVRTLCSLWLTNILRPAICFLIYIPISEFSALCQEEKRSEVIVNIAEELASGESDMEEFSVYIERLQELAENRVRINSGQEPEISRLFFLSDYQLKTLMNHIKTSGKIVSVYELASIPGFDRSTAELMIPFITLEEESSPADSSKLRSTFLTNLIFKPRDTDTNSAGSQMKMLAKYKMTFGSFAAGFTYEKDQGEKFLSGSPPRPEFLSGYLCWSGKGIIKKIVAGDFSARFGQGTSINTGMHTSLQVTSTGYVPGRNEIRPYTSTDENNFFRGAAATLSLKNLECSFFFSGNRVDATIGFSADSANSYVENLYTPGLHNTPSLLLRKDAILSTCWGADFAIDVKLLRIGLVWSENRFSLPFNSDISKPEDLYRFAGKKNSTYTIYYNSQFKRFLLYGEMSANDISRLAFIQGVNVRPSDRLTINFMYRNYAPGFAAFYGRGPGYGTSASNERGFLGNFTFEAAKHLFIMAGCDICRFPWLRYRSSFPSFAKRYEVMLKYSPDEKVTFDLSYYSRFTMNNDQSENGIPLIRENTTGMIKGTVKYCPYENVTFTTRVDFKKAEPYDSRGMLLLQDFNYRFRKVPATIWIRCCIFNSDDWNSRLYTYENDLLYSYSIPALSGEGSRFYFMAEWEIGNRAELRIKYGLTSILENGNNADEKDELKLQLRVWF